MQRNCIVQHTPITPFLLRLREQPSPLNKLTAIMTLRGSIKCKTAPRNEQKNPIPSFRPLSGNRAIFHGRAAPRTAISPPSRPRYLPVNQGSRGCRRPRHLGDDCGRLRAECLFIAGRELWKFDGGVSTPGSLIDPNCCREMISIRRGSLRRRFAKDGALLSVRSGLCWLVALICGRKLN